MSPLDAILAEIREAAKTMTEDEFDEFLSELKDALVGTDWNDFNGDGDE